MDTPSQPKRKWLKLRHHMGLSVNKKVGLSLMSLVAATCLAVGYFCYQFIETKYIQIIRQETLNTSALLASRVSNELKHIETNARTLTDLRFSKSGTARSQKRLFGKNILALIGYEKTSFGTWTAVFQMARPGVDARRIKEWKLDLLNLKIPVDFKSINRGKKIELRGGSLGDDTPVIRMGFRLTEGAVLSVLIDQEAFTNQFLEASGYFSYLLDRHGNLLAQTDSSHFSVGEDLSHMPIVQASQATDLESGNLNFHELPNTPLQYGGWTRSHYAGTTVYSQIPRTTVTLIMAQLAKAGSPILLICALVSSLLATLLVGMFLGERLRLLGQTLAKTRTGNLDMKFPFSEAADEIGVFSRELQETWEYLKSTRIHHGTHLKLQGDHHKDWLEKQKEMTGEKKQALVLFGHIAGLDHITSKTSKPKALMKILNKFHENILNTILKHQGFVDDITGDSFTAVWGAPVEDPNSVAHALKACIHIQKIASHMERALKKAGLPKLTLRMGMHYGTVIAGPMGAQDRWEYTVIGEACEVASTVRLIAHQLGRDLLITGAVLERTPQRYRTDRVSLDQQFDHALYEISGVLSREEQKERKKKKKKEEESLTESAVPSISETAIPLGQTSEQAAASDSEELPVEEKLAESSPVEPSDDGGTEETGEDVGEELGDDDVSDEDLEKEIDAELARLEEGLDEDAIADFEKLTEEDSSAA